jgi:hypothetical protein
MYAHAHTRTPSCTHACTRSHACKRTCSSARTRAHAHAQLLSSCAALSHLYPVHLVPIVAALAAALAPSPPSPAPAPASTPSGEPGAPPPVREPAIGPGDAGQAGPYAPPVPAAASASGDGSRDGEAGPGGGGDGPAEGAGCEGTEGEGGIWREEARSWSRDGTLAVDRRALCQVPPRPAPCVSKGHRSVPVSNLRLQHAAALRLPSHPVSLGRACRAPHFRVIIARLLLRLRFKIARVVKGDGGDACGPSGRTCCEAASCAAAEMVLISVVYRHACGTMVERIKGG